MRTISRRTLAASAIALALLSGAAGAQGKGKGKEKDHDKDRKHDERVVVVPKNVVVIPQPGTVVRTTVGNGRRVPPGLAKKGGLPPGQAKKYRTDDGVVVLRDVLGRRGYTVVRTVNSGDTRYVYYRATDGSVQRAIVSPGATRLSFSNVPAALLTEILARLY